MDSNDEIGVLARAFAQHSDELERFLHRERCFAGDASHELRTPLAIIGGAAETLVHQLPADSHLVPVAERAVRTTQEMERQLTCLLLLSRDPHTLPIANVSLRPLIEECMARCQPWLARKKSNSGWTRRRKPIWRLTLNWHAASYGTCCAMRASTPLRAKFL
jgi:signal transduction histidine kinase